MAQELEFDFSQYSQFKQGVELKNCFVQDSESGISTKQLISVPALNVKGKFSGNAVATKTLLGYIVTVLEHPSVGAEQSYYSIIFQPTQFMQKKNTANQEANQEAELEARTYEFILRYNEDSNADGKDEDNIITGGIVDGINSKVFANFFVDETQKIKIDNYWFLEDNQNRILILIKGILTVWKITDEQNIIFDDFIQPENPLISWEINKKNIFEKLEDLKSQIESFKTHNQNIWKLFLFESYNENRSDNIFTDLDKSGVENTGNYRRIVTDNYTKAYGDGKRKRKIQPGDTEWDSCQNQNLYIDPWSFETSGDLLRNVPGALSDIRLLIDKFYTLFNFSPKTIHIVDLTLNITYFECYYLPKWTSPLSLIHFGSGKYFDEVLQGIYSAEDASIVNTGMKTPFIQKKCNSFFINPAAVGLQIRGSSSNVSGDEITYGYLYNRSDNSLPMYIPNEEFNGFRLPYKQRTINTNTNVLTGYTYVNYLNPMDYYDNIYPLLNYIELDDFEKNSLLNLNVRLMNGIDRVEYSHITDGYNHYDGLSYKGIYLNEDCNYPRADQSSSLAYNIYQQNATQEWYDFLTLNSNTWNIRMYQDLLNVFERYYETWIGTDENPGNVPRYVSSTLRGYDMGSDDDISVPFFGNLTFLNTLHKRNIDNNSDIALTTPTITPIKFSNLSSDMSIDDNYLPNNNINVNDPDNPTPWSNNNDNSVSTLAYIFVQQNPNNNNYEIVSTGYTGYSDELYTRLFGRTYNPIVGGTTPYYQNSITKLLNFMFDNPGPSLQMTCSYVDLYRWAIRQITYGFIPQDIRPTLLSILLKFFNNLKNLKLNTNNDNDGLLNILNNISNNLDDIISSFKEHEIELSEDIVEKIDNIKNLKISIENVVNIITSNIDNSINTINSYVGTPSLTPTRVYAFLNLIDPRFNEYLDNIINIVEQMKIDELNFNEDISIDLFIKLKDFITLQQRVIAIDDIGMLRFTNPAERWIYEQNYYTASYANSVCERIEKQGNRALLITDNSLEYWNITNNVTNPLTPNYSLDVYNITAIPDSINIFDDNAFFIGRYNQTPSWKVFMITKHGERKILSYNMLEQYFNTVVASRINRTNTNNNLRINTSIIELSNTPIIQFKLYGDRIICFNTDNGTFFEMDTMYITPGFGTGNNLMNFYKWGSNEWGHLDNHDSQKCKIKLPDISFGESVKSLNKLTIDMNMNPNYPIKEIILDQTSVAGTPIAQQRVINIHNYNARRNIIAPINNLGFNPNGQTEIRWVGGLKINKIKWEI